MKECNHILDINTILHTKDGRKIGNAIVIGREQYHWILKTDYGNELKMTSEEIEECFYIAYSDFTEETHGRTCGEMQEMMSEDHKHRVNTINPSFPQGTIRFSNGCVTMFVADGIRLGILKSNT